MPIERATRVDENLQELAVRCDLCAHGWLLRPVNASFTLRRKIDRRAVPRSE